MVSVLTFSDDPSSNPTTESYSFFVKFVFEKNENKQKEAWVGPFFNKNTYFEVGIARFTGKLLNNGCGTVREDSRLLVRTMIPRQCQTNDSETKR